MVQFASYLGRVLFFLVEVALLCQESGNSAWTPSVLENEVDDTLSLFNKKTRHLHQRGSRALADVFEKNEKKNKTMSVYRLMNQKLRHQGIFQCFVLILCLVGQLSVSGFWPLLCPFGCMYFFFSFSACDCSVILCHNKTKNCRPCFQKTSHITWDTEVPGPLNNTYFKLQLRILTHYI